MDYIVSKDDLMILANRVMPKWETLDFNDETNILSLSRTIKETDNETE
tara:strand:+ start:620 stop:763 length:144 start_codon:yes stop_codon:yes gene_type:complete